MLVFTKQKSNKTPLGTLEESFFLVSKMADQGTRSHSRFFTFNGNISTVTAVFFLVIFLQHYGSTVSKKIETDSISKLDELVVHVEHSLLKESSNDDEFQPRGTITLRSLKQKTGTFHQNDHLPREDVQLLKKMAQNDAYYRIRVPAQFGPNEDKVYVSTYVKACALLESKLSETITLSVDHLGNIYGVGLRLPVGQCNENKRFGSIPSQFNTTIQVLQQTPGALPDTQTYVQRLEKEKAEQAAGKGKDNRSFLAKYWMYIVPVVIFMLMTSQNPEQQGEGEAS